ncbi:MAG: DinB family protein [Bryobacteraceae bacterium]
MPLPAREQDVALNAELERLIYQVKVVREEADGLLWGLDDDRFNWSPGAGRWSMAQCFEHLNVTNRNMVASIEKAAREGRAAGKLSDGPFVYGFLARWFINTLQPPVKRRFKAPANFQPGPRRSLADTRAEWDRIHDKVVELIHAVNGLDLARIKVPSPASSLLKYPLGAAFWVLTGHDKRHLWQARNVRNDKSFPGN